MPKRFWTVKETQFLMDNNDKLCTWQLAKELGRTKASILMMCKKIGLKRPKGMEKDPEAMAKSGRIGRPSPKKFPPGLHRYKKGGQIPYWFIVIEGQKPMAYHRYIWLQAGREIPPGGKIRFKDGNIENVVLENLELVTSAMVDPAVKEKARKGRWANYVPMSKDDIRKYDREYKKKRREKLKAAEALKKQTSELSFVDKVLMGII